MKSMTIVTTITSTVYMGEPGPSGLPAAATAVRGRQQSRQLSDVGLHFMSETAFAAWLNTYLYRVGRENEGAWQSSDDIAGDVYEVAIYTEQPHAVSHIDNLCRYFFEGEFAGEHDDTESPDAIEGVGRLFILACDFTKSRRDDYFDALCGLWAHLADGSPVRKTNRAGVGTKGTRAVQGIEGPFWVAFR